MNAPLEEMEEVVISLKCNIIFMDKAARFETVEVQFVSEATLKKYLLINIKTNKWWLFPIYMGRSVARIRTGAVHPDGKREWVVAVVLKEIKLVYKVESVYKTETLNW